MPDALAAAGSTSGLIWLLAAVVVAGLVRGFAGFGSAMVIMPVASSVLGPVGAVVFLIFTELLGPLPNLPAALRTGNRRDVALLITGAAVALPFGLWGLSVIDPQVFGWIISVVVLLLLILTASGWRYPHALGRRLTVATGALGGFMCGVAGLPGPPVIMLYMASRLPVDVIRANFLLYLFALDLMMIPLMWVTDLLVWNIAFLGLIIGIANLIANALGARLFDPRRARLFRAVAYIVIAASAILGLPLWKGI